MPEIVPEMHRDAMEMGGAIARVDVGSEDNVSTNSGSGEVVKKEESLLPDPDQVIQEVRNDIQEAERELQEIESLEKFVPELVSSIQEVATKLIEIRQEVGIDPVEGDAKLTFAELEGKLRNIDPKDGNSIYEVLLQLYALGNERIPEGIEMLDGSNDSIDYLLRQIFLTVGEFKEAWQDYANVHTDDEDIQDMGNKAVELLNKMGTTDYDALVSTEQRIKQRLESVAKAIVNNEEIKRGLEKGKKGEYPLALSTIGIGETQYSYAIRDLEDKIYWQFSVRQIESDIYWASRQVYGLEYSVKQINDSLRERRQELQNRIALAKERMNRAREQGELKSTVDALRTQVANLERRMDVLEEELQGNQPKEPMDGLTESENNPVDEGRKRGMNRLIALFKKVFRT